MKNISTIIFLLFALVSESSAQEIKGIIKNTENEPIKYATIYIEELQTGTSANQDGEFAIKVHSGEFNLDVRSLGYSPKGLKVKVDKVDIFLEITLDLQSYILAGVTVRADGEDPAYSIMRKAIARAPGFVNQAKSYTSDVYIKGSVKVNKIPKVLQKRLEVNGQKPKAGDTYVNESINRIRFKAPDSYQQEVISVNNTFPINDKDVPVIGLISGSIYKSVDDFYISPFAPNAFSHYIFKFEGLLQDGSQFIDKIKVTPKRNSKLLFEGYLYIVEDNWCLYSYDLSIKPMYAKLDIKQHFAPVKGNNYFPVNMFVKADISAMGVKAEATYTTTIKYDSVILNPKFAMASMRQKIVIDTNTYHQEKVDPKVEEVNQKFDELLQNQELTNHEMVQLQKLMSKKASLQNPDGKSPLEITSSYKTIVSKDAINYDSVYWDSVRPVPASDDEKISYKQREQKKQAEDSTSSFKKAAKIVLFGNYEWERSKKVYVFYPGLISIRNVGFNPVDGFNVMQSFKLRLAFDQSMVLRIYGNGGYAFGRKQFLGNSQIICQYKRDKRAELKINAGIGTVDFSGEIGTPDLVNATYNLFLKESFKKYYFSTYIDAVNNYELVNGLLITPGVKWLKADSISNTTNFSFLYQNNKYLANIPSNISIDSSNLFPRKVFEVQMGIYYTPRQHYSMDNGIKRLHQADWPTFGILYKGGMQLTGNYSGYHLIEFSLAQKITIYSTSEFKYRLQAGHFFNQHQMHFSSYRHFNTIQEEITTRSFNNVYFLTRNYEYSTADKYVELHLKYTSSFLLLKHLPYLSNQLWKENIYLNCLLVPGHYPYREIGYSMSEIFFVGEIGAYVGFKGSGFYGAGVRTVFNF